MNNNIKSILIFAMGLGSGLVAGGMYVKKKYSDLFEQDLADMKAHYEELLTDKEGPGNEEDVANESKPEEKEELTDAKQLAQNARRKSIEMLNSREHVNYNDICTKSEYTNPKRLAEDKEAQQEETVRNIFDGQRPYVVSPEEFGEAGYDTITWFYYTDGVVADNDDLMIEAGEIQDSIGAESLQTFGQFDDDSVYVRNDRLQVDYEILLSQKSYSEDVVPTRPHANGKVVYGIKPDEEESEE